MNSNTRIVIIGGGWAGIATALELSQYNLAITLIESNQELGGKGRNISIDDCEIDNGQHLMIGAYSEILRLSKIMGLQETSLFHRLPTLLESRSYKHPGFRLSLGKLPAPLHFVVGLLGAKGFSVKEKLSIVKLCLTLNISDFKVERDHPLSSWLSSHDQDNKAIQQFWRPLCLAILNTPIEIASTEVFLRVLKDSFTKKREHSDFLFAKKNIGQLFPKPAMQYLKQRNIDIRTGLRVKHVMYDKGKYVLHTVDQTIIADQLVLAVPPPQCIRITQSINELQPIRNKLERIQHSPITTIYFQYPTYVELGQPMLGISGGLLEWLIDRKISRQPGLIAAVISGPGEHMALNKHQLEEKAITEIKTLFPQWPTPTKVSIVREKRATFLCEKGINDLRPENKTPIDNLWLAGDYTNTGYPATLEGAVRSGVSCARQIVDHISKSPKTS